MLVLLYHIPFPDVFLLFSPLLLITSLFRTTPLFTINKLTWNDPSDILSSSRRTSHRARLAFSWRGAITNLFYSSLQRKSAPTFRCPHPCEIVVGRPMLQRRSENSGTIYSPGPSVVGGR